MTLDGRKRVWPADGPDQGLPLGMIYGGPRELEVSNQDPVASIKAPPAESSEPAVSLETVLSTDMSIAWDETVSIVEALCEAVQGNVLRSIPGATGIFLTGAGTVAVRSGAGTPEPVDAGRRLLELLGKGTVPAPLRLFASQAVKAEQHASIVEFMQGLSYFAKPGGQSRIAAVYDRCARELAAMPFPSEGEDRPRTPPPKSGGKTGGRGWRDAVIAVGASVVAVMVASGGYFVWQELSSGTVESGPAAAEQAVVAPPAPSTMQLAARGIGAPAATTGTPAPREPVLPARGGGKAANDGALAPRRGPLNLQAAGQLPTPAPPLEFAGNAGIVAVAAPADAAPAPAAIPLFVQETAAEPAVVDQVYSSTDAGIVPATLVREQRLPSAMVAPSGAAPLQLELIVSEQGAVERARFLAPPQRMADMMLLSSAKTWTFNPALKDGKPVRSRVVLSWLVAP